MRYTELDSDLEQLWQERAQRIRPHLPAALPLTVGDGRCPHTCERGECAFMTHVGGLMILPRGEDEAVMYLRSRRMGANRLGAISMAGGAKAVDPSNARSPWGTPMLLTGGPWEEIAANAAVTTLHLIQKRTCAGVWQWCKREDGEPPYRWVLAGQSGPAFPAESIEGFPALCVDQVLNFHKRNAAAAVAAAAQRMLDQLDAADGPGGLAAYSRGGLPFVYDRERRVFNWRLDGTHDPVQVLSGGDRWLIRCLHSDDAAWRLLWLA
mgnify:FL=1